VRLGPLQLALIGVVTFAVVLALVVAIGLSRPGSVVRPFVGAPQDQPGPVVLVPGYGGNTRALDRLAVRLRAAGRTVEVLGLPADGRGDLRMQAEALRDLVERIRGDAPSVDVVGYSAGGVVTRLWIREYGGRTVTRRVVTLGSPHHGTKVAGLAKSFSPENCPTACRQLAPDSELLNALNSDDETPDGPLWTSVWTDVDQVVTPPESARLDGARNIRLQGLCDDERVDHSGLPTAPVVVGIVLDAIATPPPATPDASDCAALRGLGSP